MPSQCAGVVDAANRSLNQGRQVEAAFNEHAEIMHQLDTGQLTAQQAFTMGMPALTKGTAASTQFDQVLGGYQQAAASFRTAATGSSPCATVVDSADQALGHAQKIEAALREHTDIMNQLDYGKITGAQATQLGKPSLTEGEAESTQFDQALARYQQLAGRCR